jgi:hypothetical protein
MLFGNNATLQFTINTHCKKLYPYFAMSSLHSENIGGGMENHKENTTNIIKEHSLLYSLGLIETDALIRTACLSTNTVPIIL